MGQVKYSTDYLLERLQDMLSKYGKIQAKLIDADSDFPSRNAYIRAFGSIEKACKLIGYEDYQKRKFTIEDAQKTLDKRNGHFRLIEFYGMREKCVIQCKECGFIYDDITPDSLLRNKTYDHFGCTNCNKKDFFAKLQNNNLKFIKYLGNGRCKVECLKCGSIIDGAEGNLTNPKYNCQSCDPRSITLKIQQYPHLYTTNTVDRANFLLSLEEIISQESLMWFYCLGFFMADGNFNSKTNRLVLWVNKRDAPIIDTMAAFLHCKSLRYDDCAGIDICGSYVVDYIIKKYNICDQKTYNPCDISSIPKEKLIAFIIGFVDGDGHIGYRSDNGRCKITIKLHLSWEDNLQYITNQLYDYFNVERITHTYHVKQPQGTYVGVTWGNKQVLNGLIKFIQENKLPVLQRKWNKILKGDDE